MAASLEMDGRMTTSSPAVHCAGVATPLSASLRLSRTRRISLKLRPVDAGYVSSALIFFSGEIQKTERTVLKSIRGWNAC